MIKTIWKNGAQLYDLEWIPVSERLPVTLNNRTGEYLVWVDYTEDGDDELIDFWDIDFYDPKKKEWQENGDHVVAWMPLPKPYEPQARSDKE